MASCVVVAAGSGSGCTSSSSSDPPAPTSAPERGRAPAPAPAGELLGPRSLGHLAGQPPSPSYEPVAGALDAIPARAWSGLRVLNQMQSSIGDRYPTDGLSLRASDVTIWRRFPDPENQWIEILTVHDYHGGDLDEAADFLEVAAVQLDDGLHIGINVRLNDSLPEYDWYTPDPVVEFNQTFDLRMDLDPATAELEVFVDGRSVGHGPVDRGPVGSAVRPDLPARLTRPGPDVDLLLSRGGVSFRSIVASDFGRRDPLISLDAADGNDGDTVVESGGRTFGRGGRLASSFASPRLVGGPWAARATASWRLGVDGSATWILADLSVWDDLVAYGGSVWWEQGFREVLAGHGSGWAFGVLPGVVDHGFVIADDAGHRLALDAGPLGRDRVTLVTTLDREAGEARLYTWTLGSGLELVDVADAGEIGAIAPGEGMSIFPDVAAADLTTLPVLVDRVLAPAELQSMLEADR